ncbi:hypothetical protein F4859DRAFT_186781 [Xylaria cf. heliscus]|nr:hypothetical protein F4859DRAFT_186781 [Xylaria cf. heliscus]
MEYSESDQVVEVLGGAVKTRVIYHSERSFAFEVTLDLVKGADFFIHKPPLHFHANQDEYIQALEGKTALELEGREIVLTPGEPEFCIKAWANHRSYPLTGARQEGTSTVKFLLSGAKTPEPFHLNLLFFENWYKYQENVIKRQGKIDFMQVFSTFDAGGTYLSPPYWMPFGQRLSQMSAILIGRWLGGLLGYQPFYREWSTHWDVACQQMRTCLFQSRFAIRPKTI